MSRGIPKVKLGIILPQGVRLCHFLSLPPTTWQKHQALVTQSESLHPEHMLLIFSWSKCQPLVLPLARCLDLPLNMKCWGNSHWHSWPLVTGDRNSGDSASQQTLVSLNFRAQLKTWTSQQYPAGKPEDQTDIQTLTYSVVYFMFDTNFPFTNILSHDTIKPVWTLFCQQTHSVLTCM